MNQYKPLSAKKKKKKQLPFDQGLNRVKEEGYLMDKILRTGALSDTFSEGSLKSLWESDIQQVIQGVPRPLLKQGWAGKTNFPPFPLVADKVNTPFGVQFRLKCVINKGVNFQGAADK